ncbi:MAG: insulinase family protein [Kiritimatiellae bacterium]|nr:insulinase family protein [Kiritimatiellia bacterium]
MMENVKVTKLANGATVVSSEMPTAESVSFGIAVRIGSRYERPAQAGMSHFLEHMLFKGTPTRTPLQISQAIESKGGSLNAYTSDDVTFYYLRIPREWIGMAVDVCMDMYLNASLRHEDFEKERMVILEEMKMYADRPHDVVVENATSALFHNHPLGAPIIGNLKSLTAMNAESLRAYKQKNYVPSNTIFSFAGCICHEQCVAYIERALAGVRRGTPLTYKPVDASTGQLPFIEAKKDIQQVHTVLAFRLFGRHDSRIYALRVLDGLLGDNMSSRLFQSIREKRGLCYAISSNIALADEVGLFSVAFGSAVDTAGKALRQVVKELRKITERQVGAAELRRVKDYLDGRTRLSQEGTLGQMQYLAGSLLHYGRFIPPEEVSGFVNDVTPTDLVRLASQIFNPARMTLSVVVPESQKETQEEWLGMLEDLA